jgi:putative phosphoribosyl transferase
MMNFASREDAGRRLGRHLQEQRVDADLVLGLPRGGVLVAAEVARILHRPLDVLIVRKIGHPWHREFAVGALAEPDVVVFNKASLRGDFLIRSQLDEVIAEETARLQEYRMKFHLASVPGLERKSVLLVDDGLATGTTAEAAVLSARRQNARKVIFAAPVASTSAFKRLAHLADAMVTLLTDPGLVAVGQYYEAFPQTDDEEVLALLKNQTVLDRSGVGIKPAS